MDKLDTDSNSSNQIDDDEYPPPRRPRTSEDFYLFCKIILEHENYETMHHNENLRITNESPMNSGADSVKSESEVASGDSITEYKTASESSDESIDGGNAEEAEEVTCYCGKPFAARPMIECSRCLTWIHLTCAKVKRTNIPDVFYCYKCKAEKIIIQQQRQRLQQHHQNHKLYFHQRERDHERERDAKRPHLQQHNDDSDDDSENILSQTVTVVVPPSPAKLQQSQVQSQISPTTTTITNNQPIINNNNNNNINNKENNIIGVVGTTTGTTTVDPFKISSTTNGNKFNQQHNHSHHHNQHNHHPSHHGNINKISHKNLTNHKRL